MMGIAIIKKLNENIPYGVKRPFAHLIRGKLTNNTIFLNQYRELMESDKLSETDIQNLQLSKLKKMLDYAYRYSDYYCGLYNNVGFIPDEMTDISQLEKLPKLSRSDLAKHYNEILNPDVKDSYEVSTGGTCGAPLHVMMERDAIYKEWAFIYHYWSKFGYDYKSSRLATFRGVDFKGKKFINNPLYAELRVNPALMNETSISDYLTEIVKFRAQFLYGYPSAVYNFCRLLEKEGISIKNRFKASFLISENLYGFQEELIHRITGAPIAIFYGHSERAVFAERYDDGYRFNLLYGYTEITETGSLIVTGFINKKTPLIRYEVDDQAIDTGNGKYGILGHHDCEVLYGANGEQITAAFINFHDGTFEGVASYQFSQDIPGVCTLRIVPSDKDLVSKRVGLIEKRVNEKLGLGFYCAIEIADEVILTARGKYKMIIQNYKVG